MLPEIVGSTIRTVLAGLAGVLVTKGYVDEGSVETIIGIGVGIATLAWSIWQKKRAKDAK